MIILEAVVVLAIAAVAIIRNVYGESMDQGREYTIPTEETTDVGIDDIELPTDLMADSDDGVEAVVGNVYNMDYSEGVLGILSEMDNKQKICAILMTSPEALCNRSNVTVAGDIFREAYAADPVAGLFFTDSNFTSEAAGMQMLSAIRGWSRDISGMNIFLGYNGEMEDPLAQTDRGINLFAILPDNQYPDEMLASATDNNMIPAKFVTLEDASAESSPLQIVATDDVDSIIGAINDGKKLMYMTGDLRGVCDGLTEAAEDGRIVAEALDSAAGYVLSFRETLTQMRPEESEKEPPEEKAPQADTKKTNNKAKAETKKKMTPEEEAAAALQALQKQAEDAMKEAVKQAEEAAKAAQEQ